MPTLTPLPVIARSIFVLTFADVCVMSVCWQVGRLNPNGTFSIIDRKKAMFKLSQGEYVSAERVEQVYGKAPMVGQIFVYGNSFKSFLLAVVAPAAEPTATWLLSKGWWPKQEKESTKLAADSFIADYK
jgi:long-chain acyl-CoA synthetase